MDKKNVLKVFDLMCSPAKPLAWLSTIGKDGTPHLAPVCFVKSLDAEKIIIGNVFIKQSEANIKMNPIVSIGVSFKNESGWDGWMVKGEAKIARAGENFESLQAEVQNISGGKRRIKSAIIVNVGKGYSLKPNEGKKRVF